MRADQDKSQAPSQDPGVSSSGAVQIWKGLYAGALSGLASRFVVYPFDTLKSQLQVQGGLQGAPAHRSLATAALQVGRTEGLPGFYRGFSTILAGVIPANMAYFGGYELGKAMVPSDWGILGNMATGAIAQVTAGVVFNPIDIIKERMQVQKLMSGVYSYGSSLDALKDLLRQDGPGGLLRGYWVTNSVWIPWNILYISSYEASRGMVAREMCKVGKVDDLPAWAIAACAAGSGGAAAIVTNPADVVKVRLQVLSAGKVGAGLSASKIAREIWLKEGLAGFFAGTSARVMSIAPGCAISWLLYENIKLLL
mmetsp:Transcript_8646/g.24860  ORF Transcript_8646/g.24860 Transcript_8646/m.24860 type:complete len:310 (+) Transcript_8646:278-1207(+)|eukprot:CAMPEP_0117667754 /NCGR_PEP_ID=MMETSP0804-20121206/11152_1 /TAXON_ID=1074897 /ORGANISM="Tetraselmis astigmatica, Strain CCMP880" /LENGTH=309 /DNA_ID=CAMNT_0005475535 /DNA_START=237 /DNA_END=1166 /DNA_ORIENTATION=+